MCHGQRTHLAARPPAHGLPRFAADTTRVRVRCISPPGSDVITSTELPGAGCEHRARAVRRHVRYDCLATVCIPHGQCADTRQDEMLNVTVQDHSPMQGTAIFHRLGLVYLHPVTASTLIELSNNLPHRFYTQQARGREMQSKWMNSWTPVGAYAETTRKSYVSGAIPTDDSDLTFRPARRNVHSHVALAERPQYVASDSRHSRCQAEPAPVGVASQTAWNLMSTRTRGWTLRAQEI